MSVTLALFVRSGILYPSVLMTLAVIATGCNCWWI